MAPKHILFLLGIYPSYGGVEMVTTVLANRFIADGHCVTIASFSQPKNDFAELHLSKKCHLLSLSYPVLSIKNVKKLKAYVRDRHVDVLINQWVLPFMVTLMWKCALAGTGCKVYSVQHIPPDTNMCIQSLKRKMELGKWYFKGVYGLVREVSRLSLAFCIKNSHKFIVLSPSFVPVAQTFSRVSKTDKIIAIPDPNSVDGCNKNLIKEKEILYVGRIEYNQKRTDRVIDVWKELEPLYSDWKLTIVGDGDDREDLQKRINEYGLKQVEITGFVNPQEYYKRASILLLTSEYEGFGLVIVEAMSYGVVPVVYNSFKTASDLITHGYNGLLQESPFSIFDFTRKVRELMDNPDYLNELSKNGRIVSTDFSIDKIVNKWYRLMIS